MYFGSFLTHLGTAFWYQSPTGIVLSLWVLAVYKIALRYEELAAICACAVARS
jgi:methylene-fatty-acyl-phospholipid synthase